MVNLSKAVLKVLRARNAEVVAHRLGVEAGAAGQPITNNPYLDDLATDWLDGHAEGTVTP